MNNPDSAAPGQRSGADLLCDTLLAEGVDMCFANPGTSEMHFVAALDRQPRMRCVLGLFEGVVTGAADGYARMADKPACTLLHTGPGLANALANLHNARRAGTPMVNVVGDHSTPHLPFDAPLTSDIEGLARPMSHWVGRSRSADDLGRAAQEAIHHAWVAPGQIATLILPADHAWGATAVATPAVQVRAQAPAPANAAIAQAAAACRAGQGQPGSTVLMLAGVALREEGLALASHIAAATGARLLAPQASTRVQRGLGRVMIDRVPYVVDAALKFLAPTQRLVLVGAKAPVGFFGYPGKPSSMLPAGCDIITAATPGEDLLVTLQLLAQALGLRPTRGAAKGHAAERQALPEPQGALTISAVAQSVVAQLPEGAVVCDESITSGRDFFPRSWHAAPHDYLQLTGGAIGIGLPLATGAALGAPGRKVVALQADGSAMYTLQALWTQARERLNVVTVIFSNRSYAILHGELKQVGAAAAAGENARRMLDLDNPALDWVKLAQGMGVEAARADTAERFHELLAAAMARNTPFLIEAVL